MSKVSEHGVDDHWGLPKRTDWAEILGFLGVLNLWPVMIELNVDIRGR